MFEKERVKKMIEVLKERRLRNIQISNDVYYKEGDFKTPSQAGQDGFLLYKPDMYWGGDDKRVWFRTEISVGEIKKESQLVMTLKTGREAEWDALNPQLLLFINGEIKQGMDVNHREVIISSEEVSKKHYILDFHGYAGMQGKPVKFDLSFALLDVETEQLIYDLKVPYETACLLEEDDERYVKILSSLINALNLIDLFSPENSSKYLESILLARASLKMSLYDNEKLINCLIEKDLLPTVSTVGHSHIDVAWLWTLRQTREKAVRSFSTVLNLMDDYPEYLFMASQPILLEFIREDYPRLFQKIQRYVKRGQFEIEGGMWLEADCNLSSGESLIRHILYGKAYMKKHFDCDSKILWLPDVFGYSAALPQILKQFGIDTFVTTKISWNEYNKLPYDTFMWQGLDGSEVLSYFMTMMSYEAYQKGSFKTVYEGVIEPSQIKGAWSRYQEKEVNKDILVSYGYGDGGGGPTKEMLENARRMAKYIPGLPLQKHTKVGSYFKKLHERLEELPKWVGELYLEYHRGTLTTMGQSKWYNRKSEFMYQLLEKLASTVLNNLEISYNHQLLRDGWDIILLNQFHDIIPGTSIKEVYEESFGQYEKILKVGHQYLNQLLDCLSDAVFVKASETHLLVYNPHSIKEKQIISFESDCPYKIMADQPIKSQFNGQHVTFIDNLPSIGYKIYRLDIEKPSKSIIDQNKCFETEYYQIEVNEYGEIMSLYDRQEKRQIVKSRPLNQLKVYEDRPHNWDAWDINLYYKDKGRLIRQVELLEVVEDGEVFVQLKCQKKWQTSTITQNTIFYKNSRRIDFDTHVDWHEEHTLLRTEFEVDVHRSFATYETQFGVIERPTHHNTSWDEAKFEVCGHKWCDLSEQNYGVSLMSDSKYGYDIFGSKMGISLLKSSKYPNPEADQGSHHFTYSLLPHLGDWKTSTIQEAHNLNCKPITKIYEETGILGAKEKSYYAVDKKNVMIDTIKSSEDQSATVIRLFESVGSRTQVSLSIHHAYQEVYEINLLEEVISSNIKGDILIEIKPFEIKSFLVK